MDSTLCKEVGQPSVIPIRTPVSIRYGTGSDCYETDRSPGEWHGPAVNDRDRNLVGAGMTPFLAGIGWSEKLSRAEYRDFLTGIYRIRFLQTFQLNNSGGTATI